MLLVIDNYDSFTYNLVQYFGALGVEQRVFRNDKITREEAVALNPDRLLISPGPCTPDEAGISIPLIEAFAGRAPILGVCLGHQSIAQHFGASIVRAERLMHGKTSTIHTNGDQLFEGLPAEFQVARYHSLIVDPKTVPENLTVIASTEKGEIMGCRHKELPIWGVQFHPESIATENGIAILENFLKA
jgi:anthranilate synthase component 2